MSNEVTELLDALHEGTISIDEVARRFRARTWPRRRRPPADSYLDTLAAELQDPGTYIPGSFDDVIAAYDQRKIDREQLRILSEAVAEAQRNEDIAQ